MHPANWIKTTLKYELDAIDYTTVTDPSAVGNPPPFYPGGSVLAGNYDAHTFSLETALTPWPWLNLAATFSYSNSRTVSGDNGYAGVQPYEGDIYSVLASANIIAGPKTQWTFTYTFSHAGDYRQDQPALSLPWGIEYDRHALLGGLEPALEEKPQRGSAVWLFLLRRTHLRRSVRLHRAWHLRLPEMDF